MKRRTSGALKLLLVLWLVGAPLALVQIDLLTFCKLKTDKYFFRKSVILMPILTQGYSFYRAMELTPLHERAGHFR